MAIAGAIEAMGADLTLGHSNTVNQVLKLGKLQRGESQAAGNLLNHALVLRRVGLRVLLKVGLVVALEVADDAMQ